MTIKKFLPALALTIFSTAAVAETKSSVFVSLGQADLSARLITRMRN